MTTWEKDIAIIKEAIRVNNGFIRQFLAAPRISSFFIAFGVAGIIIPLAWHLTLIQYGSLSSIPTALTILLIAVTLVTLAGLSAWKIRAVSRSVHEVDSQATWTSTVTELAEHPIFVAQGLLMLLTIGIAIIASVQQTTHIVPAVVAGGIATIFLLYTVAFLLYEYMPITIWLYLVIPVSLLAPRIPPLVMTAVAFGVGFLLFGIFALWRTHVQKRESHHA